MLRFLNDLFGELDGSNTILRHVAVNAPGDTPHRLMEENALVRVRSLPRITRLLSNVSRFA